MSKRIIVNKRKDGTISFSKDKYISPLKGKTYLITANKVEDNAFMFYCIDVAAAVEWLKLKISHVGFSYELIDEAFEDVVVKK
jgi:hypothetical protein